MSLKAYDGMMTRKGFPYIHEKIKENLPLFLECSKTKLAEVFAEVFIGYADTGMNPKTATLFCYYTKQEERELSEIKVEPDTTILSFLWQVAKIMSRSEFDNKFISHLTLTLEPKGRKILVYPGIFVPGHKEILLSFLEDWYAQDQTDPPEDVPARQWEQRCNDWRDFNETRGMRIKIEIFDPTHYRDNLLEQIRGTQLIDKIFELIPSEDERKETIWKRGFIESIMEEGSVEKFFEAKEYYRSEKGQKEFAEYKKKNPITLKKIDREFILKELMPQS